MTRERYLYFSQKHDMQVTTFHSKGCLEHIKEVIERFEPEAFIELGTAGAGLCLLVNETFPAIKILSIDMNNCIRPEIRALFTDQVEFIRMNIYEKNEKLSKALGAKGRKILYCDNGNKPYEFNTFAKYLNSGDVIGCHDWGTEITAGDVRETVKEEKLKMVGKEKKNHLTRFFVKG